MTNTPKARPDALESSGLPSKKRGSVGGGGLGSGRETRGGGGGGGGPLLLSLQGLKPTTDPRLSPPYGRLGAHSQPPVAH